MELDGLKNEETKFSDCAIEDLGECGGRGENKINIQCNRHNSKKQTKISLKAMKYIN